LKRSAGRILFFFGFLLYNDDRTEKGVVLEEWTDLPLFPLNTVLFPGMVLPLHIFEERYKLMIDHCMTENRPFGVLLIHEGQEVGATAVPYDVGTTSVIAGVNHFDDGRMNIVSIGDQRFRLRAVHSQQPYLVGEAEAWPLRGTSANSAQKLVEPVRALLRQYLGLLAMAQGHKINIDEVPAEPQALAWLVAIALQVPMPQKQRLLDRPTAGEVLRAEWAIMRREQLILDHMIRTQGDQWEGGYSGFLARN
jgi:Lon protease-like protein